jgi:hypothetical protein
LVLAVDVESAKLPKTTLPLQAPSMMMKVGAELGWAGFPAIAFPNLCMFTGRVSAYLKMSGSYLIDGVAIHGVSGGPVFSDKLNGPQLIGTVSAYMPNRASGDALPGLLCVQNVATFHTVIEQMKSFDDAVAQQQAQAAKDAQAQFTPAENAVQGREHYREPDTDATPH